MVEPEQAALNRRSQAQMYGQPLADLVGRIAEALSLSQARVAEVLGLSPAMLSQLCSGQRVKIGNPAVVERLRALDELAERALQGQVTVGELPSRLDAVRTVSGAMSRTNIEQSGPLDDAAKVKAVQGLLRAVASADELMDCAEQLRKRHPAVADVLRVYGAGRTDAALEHFAGVRHLM